MGRLGSDRAVSRGEAEKLALYAGRGGQLDLEATMACIGDSASESVNDLIYAAAEGIQTLSILGSCDASKPAQAPSEFCAP